MNDSMGRFALLVGAMKSGTSNLFFVLGQHPQFSPCNLKEPSFFSDEQEYAKGFSYYRDLWDWDPAVHKVALEASTTYTKYPQQEAAQRIAEAGKDFRFIYIMRNPLERIESHIRQGLYQGFSQGLDKGLGEHEVALSRYANQLDQYTKYFPRESILLLTLEDYRRNGADVLKRVCEHLGVDQSFEFQDLDLLRHDGTVYQRRVTVNKIWSGSGVHRLLGIPYRALSQVSRWVLPGDIRESLKRAVVETDRGRFRLNDSERELVVARLTPDLRRLKSWYGVDTDHLWNLPG